MPTITTVRIEDLMAAANRYIDGQLAKANKVGAAVLTVAEAKNLAADLQDNFESSQFKYSTGSVRASDFKREFLVSLEAWAKAADKNGDGKISKTETAALPKNLRDNVLGYLEVVQSQGQSSGALTTRNTTPKSRPAEHEKAFGITTIGYEQAFRIALKAAAEDEYGLRYFVQEFGGPDGDGLSDKKAIDAEVKKLLAAGSMELIDKNDEIPTGEENKENWIFSISTDGQGDHGLWAIVDRQTGDVTVSSFN